MAGVTEVAGGVGDCDIARGSAKARAARGAAWRVGGRDGSIAGQALPSGLHFTRCACSRSTPRRRQAASPCGRTARCGSNGRSRTGGRSASACRTWSSAHCATRIGALRRCRPVRGRRGPRVAHRAAGRDRHRAGPGLRERAAPRGRLGARGARGRRARPAEAGHLVVAWCDARRGEVFAQCFGTVDGLRGLARRTSGGSSPAPWPRGGRPSRVTVRSR